MKILQNAKRVQRAVLHSHVLGGNLAEELKEVAAKAVKGGINSDDWKKYMAIFADNEQQLQRLIGKNDPPIPPGENDKWFQESLAYLASNGVCASPSTARFIDNIDTRIDNGIDPASGPLSVEPALDISLVHPEIPIPDVP